MVSGSPRHLEESSIDFRRDLPPADLISRGREHLERARREIIDHRAEMNSRTACARYARFHDRLLRALYRHLLDQWNREKGSPPGSLCLAAQGGYGRRELAPFSDIDLLFLTGDEKEHQEEFVKRFLHVLFDWRLDVGFAVRSVSDCLERIGGDVHSATAMIQTRYLAGSRPLYQHFAETFGRVLRGRGRKWFLNGIAGEWDERHRKHQDSIYLLEPNIKDSRGGLRDLHSVKWAAFVAHGRPELTALADAGLLTPGELRKVRAAEEFILRIRNEMHLIAGRKTDVLTFDLGVELTRRFGFEGDSVVLAEENLMREYYKHARNMARYCSRAFFVLLRSEKSTYASVMGTLKRKRINRNLAAQDGSIFLASDDPAYFREDPTRLMDLFLRARRMGLRVSDRTGDIIEKIAPKLDEKFAEDPRNRDMFLELLEGERHVAQTLSDMHDCGLLSVYVPEFKHVQCMVRMDHYHRYTVDEHLIKAVEMHERLLAEPEDQMTHAGEIARQIRRRDLLNMALLLHDVGKGYGGGHALRGGQLLQRIGTRMGLPSDDVEMLRFLVLAHLKFNHVSQRRDLYDPRVGKELAEEMGDVERLKMLYVHSVCDLMAVSPEAMTEWKAMLYEKCYRTTEAALEGRPHVPDFEREEARLTSLAERIWNELKHGDPPLPDGEAEREKLRARLERFLRAVPQRYLQTSHVATLSRHFLMLQKLDECNRVLWNLEESFGLSELTVVSSDVPGSIALICGALAAKEINICSAQIFSTSDGYAINRFQVTDAFNRPLPPGFKLDRLREDLNRVFLGEQTIEALIEKYRPPRPQRRAAPISRYPTEVRVDNRGSQEQTILEVRSTDRPGLLFEITSVLAEFQLNIHRAMLATEAYGVVDVFYVTDLQYNKFNDDRQIGKLRRAIIEKLEGGAAQVD